VTSRELNVHIGEVKIGRNNDVLRAILGSCVGIGLLWPEKKVYGLAHCLLSKAPKKTFEISGRYVDQAILSLLAMMHIRNEDYGQIQVIVVGGGNMTMPDITDSKKLVGWVNVRTTFNCLSDLGLRVIHEDTGGTEGRKLKIECSTGTYEIINIPRLLTT
jgi:chemotaxis protein CheD